MRVYPTGSGPWDFDESSIPDYGDDGYYRTGQTESEVAAILRRIQDCVREGRFIVLDGDGREDNVSFLNAYGLYTRREQAKLLLSIDVSDFCHTIRASDGSELYVFCIRYSGYKALVGACDVWVYVKHRCPPSSTPYDCVISMHELKYPIDLPFRDC